MSAVAEVFFAVFEPLHALAHGLALGLLTEHPALCGGLLDVDDDCWEAAQEAELEAALERSRDQMRREPSARELAAEAELCWRSGRRKMGRAASKLVPMHTALLFCAVAGALVCRSSGAAISRPHRRPRQLVAAADPTTTTGDHDFVVSHEFAICHRTQPAPEPGERAGQRASRVPAPARRIQRG